MLTSLNRNERCWATTLTNGARYLQLVSGKRCSFLTNPQVWIRMASKGQTNDGGIEYSTDPKNIAKRVAEYEQAKRQRDLEREAGL